MEISRGILILVPSEWSQNDRGVFLESIAKRLLEKQRYRIVERVRYTGMEIDLVADHLDTQQRAFVECKFVEDPLSANVLDLLIGKAVRRGVDIAYLFSTAPLGKEARGALDEIKKRDILPVKVAYVGPEDIVDMFISVYGARLPQELSLSQRSITHASLVISKGVEPFWVLEEQQDGVPTRLYLYSKNDSVPFETMSNLLKEHHLYSDIEAVPWEINQENIPSKDTEDLEEEIVAGIVAAESLDDYRPSRPQDFVGRYHIQKQIWQFLEEVRRGKTQLRILAISGPSGFGKSSLIVKIADRFRNRKWRNKFYLFHVDVRSAKSSLFVARAVKEGFQNAINDGFLEMDDEVVITNSRRVLSGDSIHRALEYLKKHERVLVLFFDQFEEIFAKEELYPIFEAFQRLAYEIHSLQTSLVLGFAWRTGITFSDDNPAYHLWHSLSDLRFEVQVEPFTSSEASQMITQFEKTFNEKLITPLRRRLLEQYQGFPWLLKKLCIHIYREMGKGIDQKTLLAAHLNIKALFDSDLEPLTEEQVACLKYIAQNSPVEIVDVLDKFERDVVNFLYWYRLITRTGHKYAVYWDIFRDYLVEGTVPTILLTYVPQAELTMAVKALMELYRHKNKGLSLKSLAQATGYKEKTVLNILSDLQNFLLIKKDNTGIYSLTVANNASSPKAMLYEVAVFLQKQLREHVVIKLLYEKLRPGDSTNAGQLKDLMRTAYKSANLKSRTIEIYLRRLMPWLLFCGLVQQQGEMVVRPVSIEITEQHLEAFYGKIHRYRGMDRMFMCESSPKKVLELAGKLKEKSFIRKNEVMAQHYRNAASDLIALGLAVWEGAYLAATGDLLNIEPDTLERKLAEIASSTRFIKDLSRLVSDPSIRATADESVQIGNTLAKHLGRKWSRASSIRYVGSGKRWLRFISKTLEQ